MAERQEVIASQAGCLPVVGELGLQAFAGEEDTAFDGAERKIHFFGNLVIFVSGNVH